MKKRIILILSSVLLIICLSYSIITKHDLTNSRIEIALNYCNKNKIITDYIIFVNFSIHSGKYRFFVYDTKLKSIVIKSLCAHGNGLNSTNLTPVFSNIPNSHCSSLGFFKVKNFNYMSDNTPSYILDGLNSTNNNARIRQILIHPWYSISPIAIFPFYTDMNISRGCFVIDNISFNKLNKLINKSKNNIILYSYIEN